MTDGSPLTLDSTDALPKFRQQLLTWYRLHHRSLPWRNTRNPYAIWISEIMLQQTQVGTVIDYYLRFLQRYPDVRDLADAPEQSVLALWAGLGYYRRARQLHAAAQHIVSHHAGKFPETFDEVHALPGVGRYTAGAIVSFAFGHRAPILEANTVRLFSRLLGLQDDPKSSASQTKLWRFAEHILPPAGDKVGTVNQALMELGSLICTPQKPNCQICPVKRYCAAFQQGKQLEIPRLAPAKAFTQLHHALIVVQRGNRTLLRQNPQGGWWEGLWDFPRVDLSASGLQQAIGNEKGHHAELVQWTELTMQQSLELNLRTDSCKHFKTIKHGVTRYRITLHCFRAQLQSPVRLNSAHKWQWCDLRVAPELPLTSTAQKLRQWLLTTPH